MQSYGTSTLEDADIVLLPTLTTSSLLNCLIVGERKDGATIEQRDKLSQLQLIDAIT